VRFIAARVGDDLSTKDLAERIGKPHSEVKRLYSLRTLPDDIGQIKAPTTHIFEKETAIPIDIVFSMWSPFKFRPVIPTLNSLIDVTRETIRIIRTAI